MKRLPAILFLFILVFNFIGYRMVIAYMQSGGDTALEKKLDRQQYNDNELLSIKTKLNLPYYTSSHDFERSYGSINIAGVVYEYVKQRVYNDTLELLCLPNATKTKLQNVKNELTKSSADGQASLPQKKAPSSLKLSLPDFCQPIQPFSAQQPAMVREHFVYNVRFSLPGYRSRLEQPPQAIQFTS